MISTQPGNSASTAEQMEEIRRAELASLVQRAGTQMDVVVIYPEITIGKEPYWQGLTRTLDYLSSAAIKQRFGKYGGLEMALPVEGSTASPQIKGSDSERDTSSGPYQPAIRLSPPSTISTHTDLRAGVEPDSLDWEACIP